MSLSFNFAQCLPITISRRSQSTYRLSSNNVAASMFSDEQHREKFMEFPFVSGPHRDLMVDLISSLEDRIGSSLRPCNLPPDVQHFSNQTGTAQASLLIRSGLPSSQIDFILGGWIHCKLPSGGVLNITTLSAYLNSSTNAPHFLIELIQSSPTSLVMILDLLPRKDLIMYPDYLKTYYEDTQLARHGQQLQTLPEVIPYLSPSLFIRAVVSPTAILVVIDTVASEGIIEDQISPIAKELLKVWLDKCATLERLVDEAESNYLAERDSIIKKKAIEVDLGSSLPRLFGEQVADRVLDVLKEYYI